MLLFVHSLLFHIRCLLSVLQRRGMGPVDSKTACFIGKEHGRYINARLPKHGLPGVPLGSLLKFVKGAYGLREAPRLKYRRTKEGLLEAGLEERHTAKACGVLRYPRTRYIIGMLVRHVNGACFAGEGPRLPEALNHIRGICM